MIYDLSLVPALYKGGDFLNQSDLKDWLFSFVII